MNQPPLIADPALQKGFNEVRKLQQKGNYEASDNLLQRLFNSDVVKQNQKFAGEVLSLQGENYFLLGSYQQALDKFIASEVIYKGLQLTGELAHAAGNVGVAYRRLGLLGHSLLKYLEALTYAFEAGDNYCLATSLLHSAAVLFDIGRTGKAFQAIETALQFCDKEKSDARFEELRIVVLNNKATFCIHLQQFENALLLLQQAQVLVKQYPRTLHGSMIESNMALCLIKVGRFEEAAKTLQRLLKRSDKLQDDQRVADMTKLAMVYRSHFKNMAEFHRLVQEALTLAIKQKLLTRQLFIYRLLKEVYTAENNKKQLAVTERKLEELEATDRANRQTGGMESLLDAQMLTIEKKLLKEENKPGFLTRFDFLTGSFTFSTRGVTMHVPLRDIGFCEVKGNYMYLQTYSRDENGRLTPGPCYKARKTMKEFIEEIETSGQYFSRVHNSFLVNLFYLGPDSLQAGAIVIGDKQVKVSDTFRKPFKQQLNAFLEQKAGA
jgi:tetratricopeptide (TPR) repeat protein